MLQNWDPGSTFLSPDRMIGIVRLSQHQGQHYRLMLRREEMEDGWVFIDCYSTVSQGISENFVKGFHLVFQILENWRESRCLFNGGRLVHLCPHFLKGEHPNSCYFAIYDGTALGLDLDWRLADGFQAEVMVVGSVWNMCWSICTSRSLGMSGCLG